jgi:membrane protein
MYGALGTAVVFMLWLWLTNIALLFGAEINDVLADIRRDTSPAAAMLAHESDARPWTEHEAAREVEREVERAADHPIDR